MELLPARFAYRANDHWSLGFIRAEVRSHDLQLRSHLDVGIHGLAAVTPRVDDVSAVRGDIQRGSTGSVR